ncbi:hypothetical protein NQ318_019002 [Aromia moschata]|uniref:Ionotropic glutamate receptor L-glutamate and glycine-binding domain-containing protein n=1 Tax=Aromia moschata TaxID=1265417 RepID=A0AAV8YFV8_9CUCU|nr:hypothetical protein NQ318_019002 [Aromia moschata]
MRHFLANIILVLDVLMVFGLVLNRQGPTHRRFVVDCLEEIVREHFHFRYGESDENHTMLFTVMVTRDMSSPAYEIQELLLKRIHGLAKWYQVETISDGKRHEFESYTDCSDDECQHNFIVDFKSNFYAIVIQDEDDFDDMIEILRNSDTFNPRAKYLVYIENGGRDYEKVAKSILRKMWEKFVKRVGVLIPVTLRVLKFYMLNTQTAGPYPCGSNITLKEMDRCVQGRMETIKKRYYSYKRMLDHGNCSLGVISAPYQPFVINENDGFEIDVLRTIGSSLNVHFNITIADNLTDTWGSKDENGSWTGKLKYVYDDFYIGVGNVEVGLSYVTDFTFTRYYHMEPLVFVVPIAHYVPKWRVLVAIFTTKMWGLCIGVILCFAIAFWLGSKLGKETRSFKSFGAALHSSYQITLWHPVFKQPLTDLTRVFFLSMNVFSILIASAYTCSLINYLTNPIRDHQPTMNKELRDVFGRIKYQVGGMSRYRELFNTTESEKSYDIFKIYQTAEGENDTLLYWLQKVGESEDIWTISSRLVANYLIEEGDSVATHPNGEPKIFVFNEKLMSYSVGMLVRKGHPLLHDIDGVLKNLVWGGLVAHMSRKYIMAIRRSKARQVDDGNYKALTIDHLQGAFALLVMGWILALNT